MVRALAARLDGRGPILRNTSVLDNRFTRRFVRPGSKPGADDEEGEIWSLEDSCRVLGHALEDLLTARKRLHIEAARTFLPRVLQRPVVGKASGTVMHRCTGCVVFADASGFTALTETLAQRADGAEVLSKCLNKFFTPLIEIIEAYRGDVIKFSGDALSILFEATDDYTVHESPCGSPEASRRTPLQLACLRASACCLEIHKRLHNFDTGEGGVRLTLHIGVGAGGITILQVGGEHGRFEYVIAGTPMEQISVAEPLAGSGETVLSPQTWSEVSSAVVEGEPLADGPGYHRLAGMDTAQYTYPTVKYAALECTREDALRSQPIEDSELLKLSERFIPRAVLKHLRSGNSSSINEMRSVTIIFAQIGGVDVSSEQGSKVAQQLMVGMQKACYFHEGNLNKFLVDDKGLIFLFVFGLPPLIHMDDPTRAIAACFDMVRLLQGMGLRGRFGVTTGRVFCGIVGSDQRREYTVMGDTANLSARLMAKASENSVLIDEATHRRAGQDVVCKRLDPIFVKGKSQPIQCFAPVPPGVHSLRAWQLSAHLGQRSWNLQRTDLKAKLWTGREATISLPWRACSQLLGGTSPVLQLRRWRELQQVEQMIAGSLGFFKVGGSLVLLGSSGSGKQELSECLVAKAMEQQFVPLFGVMGMRVTEQWRAVAELVQNCLCVLCADSLDKAGSPQEAAVEAVLRKVVQREARLHRVLAFLGFEGFEVPGERAEAGAAAAPEELEESAAELAVGLVTAVAARQGVLVLLRARRGTDIFNGLAGRGSAFWRLSSRLTELAMRRQRELETGKEGPKPVLVVTVARSLPEASSPEYQALGPCLRGDDGPAARQLVMSPLTEDATVELMCHCLGLQTSDGGFRVKRKLREFAIAVSINNPVYIQECIQHLMLDSCVEVKGGECVIKEEDLNAVNIAEWVQTSMVGGTVSQLESLGSAKNHIMKLATVFEGPFSPLDLAAANRILFGRIPRILAFHDQAKLLSACQALVRQGFLRPVTFSAHTLPADRAPASLPRWTISNSLFRKVAGSMLLNSQRILIKRAVLISRALNVELPRRMRPGTKHGSQHVGRTTTSALAAGAEGLAHSEHDGGRETRVSFKSDASPFEPLQESHSDEDSQESADLLNSACCLGNTNLVTEILHCRPNLDLNKGSELTGYTPLHYACSGGEVEIVQLLCDHGAAVDAKSAKLETPVLIAAQRGHLEVVQHLCEARGALALCGLDNLDYWEAALPEVILEEDIPRPLAPTFPLPAVSQETASRRRKAVCAWLSQRVSRAGAADGAQQQEEPQPGARSRAASRDEDLNASAGLESGSARGHGSDEGAGARTSLSTGNSNPPHSHSQLSGASNSADAAALRKSGGGSGASPGAGRGRSFAGTPAKAIIAGMIPEPVRNAAWRARIRSFLRSRLVFAVMMVSLALALYMPDVWVSAGVPSNLGCDLILTVVMLLFLTELLLLSLVDASYPFSFFFFMDCIGTLSMISDLSFLGIGTDATEPQQNQNNDRDLTLFRATRTAKIGARAGRLSRLVKLMRFLPGIGVSRGKHANEAEKLQQISNQLTNVLSKRVACLTILLVIVMPLFTIGLYPEGDFSMQVWVESLARRVFDAQRDPSTVPDARDALRQFSLFYRDRDYGPYRVCISSSEPALQGCSSLPESGFSAPERRHFQLEVSTGPVSAFFDFSVPTRAEANMGITLISLVIVLMCGACLLLNYSASELAVRPLERMLTSIKKSAKDIFSSVHTLEPEGVDEDFTEDMDGEVALLERVVRKIATLAEISSKKNPYDEAWMKGMKSEELGVLALTSVHHCRASSNPHDTSQEVMEPSRMEVTVTMQWQLEEIGLAYGVLDSWDFNVLELSEQKQEQISAWLLMNNPGSCAYTEHNVDFQKLRTFVDLIKKGYLANPYHNFMHALDVTHTVFRYLTLMQGELLFSLLDQFALLVASVSHDIGHIGLNNVFLMEVQHELAIRYNDRSPLENLHCCKLFEILAQPGVNVFSSVSPEQYRDVRKTIIDVILHTDICQHPSMVKELELLYEMNSKVFEATTAGQLGEQEIEVLATTENKKLVLKVVLHAADTANPTKPWQIAHDWAYRVLEEYANQGDQEKKLGIPVQMLNDREKVNRPNSQIGFIEFIIAPLVVAEVKIFPSWVEASQLLEQNLKSWEQLWIQESNPSEVERQKVNERVQKIVGMLSVAPKLPQASSGSKITNRNRRMSLVG